MGKEVPPSRLFSPAVKEGKRPRAARSRNRRQVAGHSPQPNISAAAGTLGKEDLNLPPCRDLRRPPGITGGRRERKHLRKKSSLPCWPHRAGEHRWRGLEDQVRLACPAAPGRQDLAFTAVVQPSSCWPPLPRLVSHQPGGKAPTRHRTGSSLPGHQLQRLPFVTSSLQARDEAQLMSLTGEPQRWQEQGKLSSCTPWGTPEHALLPPTLLRPGRADCDRGGCLLTGHPTASPHPPHHCSRASQRALGPWRREKGNHKTPHYPHGELRKKWEKQANKHGF